MENYKTPEEILSEYIDLARSEYPDQNWMSNKEILESPENRFMIMAMAEYGKQQYNKAVFDCSEKAYKQMYDIGEYEEVIKESILELIKE